MAAFVGKYLHGRCVVGTAWTVCGECRVDVAWCVPPAYAEPNADGIRAPMLPMLTTRPRLARRSGSSAWHRRTVPKKLTCAP